MKKTLNLIIKELNKQYLMKLLGSIFASLSVYITIFYVSNTFGPKTYGEYEFLNTIFQSAIQILDAGLSLAIFRKMAMTDYKKEYYRLFVYWNVFIYFIFFIGYYLIDEYNKNLNLPISNEKILIALIAFTNILIWNVENYKKVFDSLDKTITFEYINIPIKLLSILVVIILYFSNLNSIYFVILKDIILNTVAIIFSLILVKELFIQKENRKLYKDLIIEIISYTKPLYIYALIAISAGAVERIILQYSAGSEQQGYFSLSLRIISISSLLLAPMIPLIIRDVSRYSSKKDLNRIKQIYTKNLFIFYSISALVCAFIFQNSNLIVEIIGGGIYSESAKILLILCFYQLHQSNGQINGTILLGIGKTKYYQNIGIIGALLGIILTWFLVSNTSNFTYNLGAFGLALKMVLLQLVIVSIETYYISKLLNINIISIIRNQILILMYSFILVYVSNIISNILFDSGIFILLSQLFILLILFLCNYLILKKYEFFKALYIQ